MAATQVNYTGKADDDSDLDLFKVSVAEKAEEDDDDDDDLFSMMGGNDSTETGGGEEFSIDAYISQSSSTSGGLFD